MSDSKDFVIKNGVLEKYNGPGGEVVIPDGVMESDGTFPTVLCLTIPPSSVTVPMHLAELQTHTGLGPFLSMKMATAPFLSKSSIVCSSPQIRHLHLVSGAIFSS